MLLLVAEGGYPRGGGAAGHEGGGRDREGRGRGDEEDGGEGELHADEGSGEGKRTIMCREGKKKANDVACAMGVVGVGVGAGGGLRCDAMRCALN